MAIKTKSEDGVAEAPTASAPPAQIVAAPSVAAPSILIPPGVEASPTIEQGSKTAQPTVAALKQGAAQISAGFEQTQASMKQGVEKAMKTAEEFVTFGQGNLEAFVKSGQIWTQGIQDLGKQAAAAAQASFQDTVSTVKALAGVKTLQQAIELQASYARSAVEKTLADSGRLTETSIKLTEQAMAPIAARMSLAVEKFAKPF